MPNWRSSKIENSSDGNELVNVITILPMMMIAMMMMIIMMIIMMIMMVNYD